MTIPLRGDKLNYQAKRKEGPLKSRQVILLVSSSARRYIVLGVDTVRPFGFVEFRKLGGFLDCFAFPFLSV